MTQVGSWLWDYVERLWKRAPYDVATVRMVGVGQVIAGHHSLHWMMLDPSAGNSNLELTDDIAALGAVVIDHFETDRAGEMIPFSPPMHFGTGIYLETFDNMTSITFGYV